MHILDKNLKYAWRRYILQSLLATLALIAILYFVDILTHAAIVAALGASAFIVFAMPRWITARPRNVIGGHIVGLAAGCLCYFALVGSPLQNMVSGPLLRIYAGALAVGLSIFLMVVTDTEHPPCGGHCPWHSGPRVFPRGGTLCAALCPDLISGQVPAKAMATGVGITNDYGQAQGI